MKKRDVMLILGVLVLAGICWVIPRTAGIFSGKEQRQLRITVAGEVFGEYPLEKDQKISIGDTNVCQIRDGKVKMISARCPDHLCLKQGPAARQGETIVCLPNQVVLEIRGVEGQEEALDGIVK